MADFLVGGVEHEIGDLPDRPVPPGIELLVELRRGAADLRRGALEPAEFFDFCPSHPGADALDLHLGHGEDHRPLAADAPIESLGIEGRPFAAREPRVCGIRRSIWPTRVFRILALKPLAQP